MFDALTHLHHARGVVVLLAEADPSELAALHARGIRGLRITIATAGRASIEDMGVRIEAAAQLCERHSWHIQIFVQADAIQSLAPLLTALPVETVIDHFGLIAPGAALDALIGLVANGRTWVKISGAYRIAEVPTDPCIGVLAPALRGQPERIVWGSEWPHTRTSLCAKPTVPRNCPVRTSIRATCCSSCRAGGKTTLWSGGFW